MTELELFVLVVAAVHMFCWLLDLQDFSGEPVEREVLVKKLHTELCTRFF